METNNENEELKKEDLDEAETVTAESNEAVEEKGPNKSGEGKTLFGVVIALGIVIVALIVLLIVLLVNKDDKKDEPAATATKTPTQGVTIEAEPSGVGSEGDGEGTEVIPTLVPKEFNVSVKLGNYKGLTADYEVPPVTEEDIEEEMNYFLASVEEKSPITGRAVQDGDFVLIDFVGTMNGEVFDGGSATGYELEIGSGMFIDGFESGLIGKNIGDSVSLDLTFPETYGSEELAGKAVNFMVNINEIYAYVTPELTDELVAANTSFASIEEYKQAAREAFASYNEEYADSMTKDDLIKQVIESSEFTGEIEEEIAYEAESAFQYYDLLTQSYGIDGATYFMYYYGFTEEEYKMFINEQAEFQVKYIHILDEIIKAENLTLTEEEKTGDETEDLEALRHKAENIIFDSAIINDITQKQEEPNE